jgi:hypothetical protein
MLTLNFSSVLQSSLLFSTFSIVFGLLKYTFMYFSHNFSPALLEQMPISELKIGAKVSPLFLINCIFFFFFYLRFFFLAYHCITKIGPPAYPCRPPHRPPEERRPPLAACQPRLHLLLLLLPSLRCSICSRILPRLPLRLV